MKQQAYDSTEITFVCQPAEADPVANAATAQAKLEEAIRERDAARLQLGVIKAEAARLNIQLRAQSEAFVRRVQGWATKLRNRSLHLSDDESEAYRPAGLEQLLVEMLRYSGEQPIGPSPANVERAHTRLKELQEGAAQVAAAAEGRPR